MRLLLDENCAERDFLRRLRATGHDVQSIIEVLGAGASGDAIIAYAIAESRIIVTKDAGDFVVLLRDLRAHPGLLLVYEDRHRVQASAADLARAIDNVMATYPNLESLVLALNDFKW